MKSHKEEFVIVFKKGVSEEKSLSLIESFGVEYREGMDSSKGKIYFYNTGPKYIITFETSEQKTHFQQKHYGFLPEIHQIYEANWEILKD